MNKIPAAPKAGATSENQNTSITRKRRVPKKAICLYHLTRQSLTQLEALRLYGETCLHSTISDLYNNHGLIFKRRTEPHRHQHGGLAHFTRYTLERDSMEAAHALLKFYGMEAI